MADATYKLVNEGYPVLTSGTTDRDRKFHPFGIALSFNEQNDDFKFVFDALKQSNPKYSPNVLIADNAPSINNGFEKSFTTIFEKGLELFTKNTQSIKIYQLIIFYNTLMDDLQLINGPRSFFSRFFSTFFPFLFFFKKYTKIQKSTFLTIIKKSFFLLILY